MPSSREIANTDRLSPDMTVEEVVKVAIKFEQTAYLFYTGLVEKVRPEVRPLVRDLAAEEKRHCELLDQLARSDDLGRQLQHRIKRPPTAEALESYVDIPLFPDEPLEDSLLEYAESRERIAYEHYGYLAEITPSGSVKELFEFLRDEEDGHLRALQTREAMMFSIF